ncbi:MAG: hypothetical protein IKE55_11735 [Kiritimatiellae bacterium]|nr:hypothetical protein [Kiritimatiellia bacterium]
MNSFRAQLTKAFSLLALLAVAVMPETAGGAAFERVAELGDARGSRPFASEGWENVCSARMLREPALEYWRAPFERGETAFKVDRCDGAEGEVAFAGGRMTVRKTNAAGYLLITAIDGLVKPVGTRLRSYADAEVTGSDPNYSLAFPRLLDARRRLHACFDLDAMGLFMGGGEKIAYLANTPPGTTERRFSHFRVVEEGRSKLVPALVVAGAPSVSTWVRWGVEDYAAAAEAWAKARSRFVPGENNKTNLESDVAFARRIAADVDHTAKVVKKDGRIRLVVDGRSEPPVMFKNPLSWGKGWGDYNGRAMSREGIRIHSFAVGMDRHWTNGEWNVAATVADVRDQMRVAPDALVMLSFFCTAPREYAERHPSEIWRHPNGTPCVGDWEKMRSRHHNDTNQKPLAGGCWPWISASSTVYRDYLKDVLARLVDALRREGLAKRIVGIHFCGWHDAQFAPYRADYSAPAKDGFCRYLRSRYGAAPDLAELPVPSATDLFLDPSTEKGRLEHDFNVYQHKAPFWFQEDLARHAKRCFGKDIVCIHWCMGVYAGEMYGAYYLDDFLRSDAMDGLVAQSSYVRRSPGNSIGIVPPLASFAEHGKLYVDEMDLRAWGVIPSYVKEPSLGGLGYAMDLPEWLSVNRKMTGRMIAADQGYWYFDISGGFWNPDEIEHEIGSSTAVYRELVRLPRHAWRPSAAFVVDEDGLLWRNLIGVRKHAGGAGEVSMQHHLLAASGVPYSTLTYRDAAEVPGLLSEAKVVVLAGFYEMDEPRRRFQEGLVRSGKTVVLIYGADGFRDLVRRPGLDSYVQSEKGTGDPDFMSRYHADWTRWTLGVDGGEPARDNRPLSYGFKEGDGTIVLARYRDGQPAVVRRGSVVAMGQSAGLTPRYFSRIVREAGGYVPCSRWGLQVNMNGDFVSVHALDNGRYSFRLPFACVPVNLKTGKRAPVDGGAMELDLTAGETRWYRLCRD